MRVRNVRCEAVADHHAHHSCCIVCIVLGGLSTHTMCRGRRVRTDSQSIKRAEFGQERTASAGGPNVVIEAGDEGMLPVPTHPEAPMHEHEHRLRRSWEGGFGHEHVQLMLSWIGRSPAVLLAVVLHVAPNEGAWRGGSGPLAARACCAAAAAAARGGIRAASGAGRMMMGRRAKASGKAGESCGG